jgi:hypothetical protein
MRQEYVLAVGIDSGATIPRTHFAEMRVTLLGKHENHVDENDRKTGMNRNYQSLSRTESAIKKGQTVTCQDEGQAKTNGDKAMGLNYGPLSMEQDVLEVTNSKKRQRKFYGPGASNKKREEARQLFGWSNEPVEAENGESKYRAEQAVGLSTVGTILKYSR